MTVSAPEAVRASRKRKAVEIPPGVAVISANAADLGMGFWSKVRWGFQEQYFTSHSREKAIALATGFSNSVVMAREIRLLGEG